MLIVHRFRIVEYVDALPAVNKLKQEGFEYSKRPTADHRSPKANEQHVDAVAAVAAVAAWEIRAPFAHRWDPTINPSRRFFSLFGLRWGVAALHSNVAQRK